MEEKSSEKWPHRVVQRHDQEIRSGDLSCMIFIISYLIKEHKNIFELKIRQIIIA